MKTAGILAIGLIGIIIVIAGAYFLVDVFSGPGELDSFAQCLKEKGAIFYGAFWCPHCQAQKVLFGSSVKYLNYVECSTPDGSRQTTVCQEKGITGYPTWVFIDGTRESGEVSLKKLAEKTQCLLP